MTTKLYGIVKTSMYTDEAVNRQCTSHNEKERQSVYKRYAFTHVEELKCVSVQE